MRNISILKLRAISFSLIFLAAFPNLSLAEEKSNNAMNSSDDVFDLSLEELMDVQVAVASGKNTSIREAPGIVSLVTANEIRNAGARDLIDVLQMVPGIQMGVDVAGAISIGIRGLWAHEGKALLLWDGHELNELMYSTIQLGNRYPIDQIERVEIIRGPGSALYGGYAELAVINIITKDYAEGKSSGETTVTYGQMSKTFARRNANIAFGKKFNDLKVNTALFVGEANRSNKNYTDLNGDRYDMTDNAQLKPENYKLNLNYKNLDFRFLYDNYETTQRDEFGENLAKSVPTDFKSYYFDLRYVHQINNRLKIIPRVSFKNQIPWREKLEPELNNFTYDKRVQKKTATVTAEYDPRDDLALTLGAAFSEDRAVDRLPNSYFFNNKSSLQYQDYAIFSQAVYQAPIANFTLGGRYYDHQAYGSALVPRFSVTKAIDKLHFKFLASEAFRAPSIENINIGQTLLANGYPGAKPIDPEKTRAYEFETGYSFTDSTLLVFNVFQAKIDDPIVFFYDNINDQEGYLNAGHMGSRGFETELRFKDDWGYLNFSYSYYRSYENNTQAYMVSPSSNYMVGFARNQFSTNLNLTLNDTIKLNTFLTVLGKRFGYDRIDDEGNAKLSSFDPIILANLYISKDLKDIPGLQVGLGLYNFLGTNYKYIQPHNGGHAPLPGLSPEILLKLIYSF